VNGYEAVKLWWSYVNDNDKDALATCAKDQKSILHYCCSMSLSMSYIVFLLTTVRTFCILASLGRYIDNIREQYERSKGIPTTGNR